jgi:hypothetical protein
LEHFDGLDRVWLPIVQTFADTGKFEILPYASIRMDSPVNRARIEAAQLRVVPEVCAQPRHVAEQVHDVPSLSQSEMAACRDRRFARISKGFDLKRHAATRLVVIGTGGSASLIANCARMGFEDFILIDPDILVDANVASQQANTDHIGKPKVEALAEQIVKINPCASVKPRICRIEDIDDNDFADLLFSRREPSHAASQSILLVLTDNFYAQARGHRLGLHFGIPTICAQEYLEGCGAEVTYTVPGVTPACHRCITSSRYTRYLEAGYTNDVTSEGAPVFAADFLNAVIGHILLAIVYHGTKHPRFGKLIESIGNRNLIQLRMDPQFEFARSLSRSMESSVMLDSAFLAQTPDCGQSSSRPRCPDCGGTGDLRDATGGFLDTRITRRQSTTGSEFSLSAPVQGQSSPG